MPDPLRYDVPLPLRADFHPMGFPIRIETNSEDILAIAKGLWAAYPNAFSGRRVELRVAVGDHSTLPLTPSLPRGQRHLISIVHSTENFATADLARGFAFAWLTSDVAADHAYASHHFLEPLVYVLLDGLHLTPVHAACVALDQDAVLLCGDSGAGKSSLAYACARRGWRYVADDVTHVVRHRRDHTVVGRPCQIRLRAASQEIFPELQHFPRQQSLNGKLDIRVATAELGLATQLSARLGLLVFLDRRPGAQPAAIEPVKPGEALTAFEQVICFGSASIRRKHAECLQHLVTLPLRRLIYTDFDDADATLRSLLHAGH